jgi:hypothetical protein
MSHDPELAHLWHASEDERRTGAGYVIDALLRKGPLKAGLYRDTAIDLLWVLTSSVSFHSLVRTRGWPGGVPPISRRVGYLALKGEARLPGVLPV